MRVRFPVIGLNMAIIAAALVVGCNPAPTAAPKSDPKPVPATNTPPATNTAPANHNTEVTPPPAASTTESETASFFTVGNYDVASDPVKNLTATIARAQTENKRILLHVGGEWCGWCKLMSKFMVTNPAVKSHLEKNFLIMKVTYPGDHAEAFLAKYPKIEAYPHVFVLETNGELLHSQGTGELEQGQGYNESLFLKFLTEWTR